MSRSNQVTRTGPDTYTAVDGLTAYQRIGNEWHRFDLGYSATSPCDPPGYGFGSLDEAVESMTGRAAEVVSQ